MKHTVSIVAVLACAAALAGVAPTLLAQPAATSTAPRTSWGAPDLRGVWNGTTITPLQRPENQAKEFLDRRGGAGARGRCGQAQRNRRAAGGRRSRNLQPDLVRSGLALGAQPPHVARRRPEGRAHSVHRRGPRAVSHVERPLRPGRGAPSGPTSTPASGASPTACRCYFAGYNNNYQIFQTESHVVIVGEMFGDRRVVLPRRPAAAGDSAVARHLAGPVGGRHARGRDHGLCRQGPLLVGRRVARVAAVAAAGGTLHARRRRDHRLPVHDGRPGDVHAAVDGAVPAVVEPGVPRRDRRPPLRVRVP